MKYLYCCILVASNYLYSINSQFTPKFLENGIKYQVFDEAIRSPRNDSSSEHHYIVLENGLQVMIVSDPAVQRASVSLAIQVGTKSDPRPGLASLVSRALFTGCERYPQLGDFLRFLRNNWGYVDSSVHYEYTIFDMMISNSQLESGLDYFLHSLIKPSFPISGIYWALEDEFNEFERYSRSDIYRAEQVQRNLSDPTHPFSAPNVGVKESLKSYLYQPNTNLQQELIDFVSKFYSSNLMKLVVLGDKSLEELEKITVTKFSSLPNKKIPKPHHPGVPYQIKHLSKKILVAPLKTTRIMNCHFLLPGLEDSTSYQYIEFLLSHEGHSSFNHQLKALGYATTIINRITKQFTEFSIYEISIELTPLGEIYNDQILSLLFQYVDLIKQQGVNQKNYTEFQALKALGLQLQEKLFPVEFTESLATFMLKPISPRYLLEASAYLGPFNPELIQAILNGFTSENLRVTLISEQVKDRTDLIKEPMFNTSFTVEPISTLNVASKIDLKIPDLAMFFPESMQIIPKPTTKYKTPKRLIKNSNGALWFFPGNYSVPRTCVRLGLFNDQAHQSARASVNLDILKEAIRHETRDLFFSARIVGIELELEKSHNAIIIILSGFGDQPCYFINLFLQRLIQMDISKISFLNAISEVSQHLKTQTFSSVKRASQLTVYGMLEHTWSNEEKFSNLLDVAQQELTDFSKSFISNSYLQYLITGNITPEKSIESFRNITLLLNGSVSETHTALRGIALPPLSLIHRVPASDPESRQSAIEFYIDTYSYSNFTARVFTELASFLINEPAQEYFCSVEKLCALSIAGKFSFAGRGGIRIMMMTHLDPNLVEKKIEIFLKSFTESIKIINHETFNKSIQDFLTWKREPSPHLNHATNKIWDQIISECYDFNNIARLETFLNSTTPALLHQFLQQSVPQTSKHRRKLSVHVVAQNLWVEPEFNPLPTPEFLKMFQNDQPTESSNITIVQPPVEIVIYNLDEWKRSQELASFPDAPSDTEYLVSTES